MCQALFYLLAVNSQNSVLEVPTVIKYMKQRVYQIGERSYGEKNIRKGPLCAREGF